VAAEVAEAAAVAEVAEAAGVALDAEDAVSTGVAPAVRLGARAVGAKPAGPPELIQLNVMAGFDKVDPANACLQSSALARYVWVIVRA